MWGGGGCRDRCVGYTNPLHIRRAHKPAVLQIIGVQVGNRHGCLLPGRDYGAML